MGQISPVQKIARMNFSTRFSNSSGNFKPFGKKIRRNPSIFTPEINGWSLVRNVIRDAGRKSKKVDKIANSGPILINFFFNRLNFSRRTRISGLKMHRKNAKWLKSMPGSLKNVTYNIGACVCFTMEVSQLVRIPVSGPILIKNFLIRLNFSWGIRKSGLKNHRKTFKVISRNPALRTTINVWRIPSSSVRTYCQGLAEFNCRGAMGPPENWVLWNF